MNLLTAAAAAVVVFLLVASVHGQSCIFDHECQRLEKCVGAEGEREE